MIIDQPLKHCGKCGTAKPHTCFGNDRSKADLLACWCKDCLNENSRKYHAANRETVLRRHGLWLKANPSDRAVAAERTRRWREENPEHARELRKSGKLRRRVRTEGGMSAPELRAWIKAQPKVCHWCGLAAEVYDIDHLVPLSKGGEHQAHNLVVSCPPCNRRKGAKHPDEFLKILEASHDH